MQKRAAVLMILGSLLFVAGVTSPPVMTFFSASDNTEKLTILQSGRFGWNMGHLVTGIGTLFVAAGFALLVRYVPRLMTDQSLRLIGYTSVALAVVSAFMWCIICFRRMTISAEAIVTNQNVIPGVFYIYSISIGLAMLLLAYTLLRTGYPKWFGAFVFLASAALLISHLVTGDLIPALWYLLLIVVGVALIFVKSRFTPKGERGIVGSA